MILMNPDIVLQMMLPPSLYEASIVSDMDGEGKRAVEWLKSQNLDEINVIHIQGVMGSAPGLSCGISGYSAIYCNAGRYVFCAWHDYYC